MQTYLREYQNLKTYPVIGPAEHEDVLEGLLFDDAEWRIREIRVDLEPPAAIDVADVDCLVDAPPSLLLRVGGQGVRQAAAGSAYRYVDELLGCGVVARDGVAGCISDVLVNTRHWKLRYFVVDTGGRSTLLHVRWTSDIDGGEPAVLVAALPAKAIRTAPVYEGLEKLTPGFQDVLYRHYTSRDFLQVTPGSAS